MEKRLLETLEYDKITAMLAKFAKCCVSRELIEELIPENELNAVNARLNLTAEAEAILNRLGSSPIDDFPDMREQLSRLRDGSVLSLKELLSVCSCLRAMRLAKTALAKETAQARISEMGTLLPSYRFIEDELNRCILNEDELFDGASPELSRIRRALKVANEKAREKLNSMLHSSTYQKYLQEPIITMRNGRFVLPVRQEYRKQIPGLIHDQSGSGQTLFIEPAAVVELGNQCKKLAAEERDEVNRILMELTAMLVPYTREILSGLALMGQIDVPFAMARLAQEMRALQPEMNTNGVIRIVRGRHPLIDKEKVVPIDMWLGKDFRTLIITGPNTGGKTVTLKTVGLFTLMAQSGMFVPAGSGTILSVFESVYADIGDEQSIEQSLSTFSSHMTRIVDILGKADNKALVLLDELGAGTDPIEGAALAMSILEELHGRNTVTLATTHYSEIKAFALSREGMENASMEFDIEKLAPTYRLFIGIPGKSNAFEISRRLGLSEHTIDRAREFLKQDDIRFEDIISGAESQRRIAEEERALAEQARAELDKLRDEAERERKKLAETKRTYQAKAREEARKLVEDTKREMDRLVAQIRSIKTIDRSQADRTIQQARDELRHIEKELPQEELVVAQDMSLAPKSVKKGDEVRVLSLDKHGTVLFYDGKDEALVQVGIMRITAKLSDLRLERTEEKNVDASSVSLKDNSIGLSLDVRGKTVDEAVVDIDRYLEAAAMKGLLEVTIIHGKGTGALRTGVQAYLKNHRLVKSFRIGAYGEGDAGVTNVTLKEFPKKSR